MQISKVIKELEVIRDEHGELRVFLQNSPKPGEDMVSNESFFIVPEQYDEPNEVHVNIRTWPY